MVSEQRRNWGSAEADLTALLKVDPDNAMANYRLGRALFMQKKFKEGLAEFTKAATLDKKLPNPHISAAVALQQLDMDNEAKAAFEDAVRAERLQPIKRPPIP